MKVLGTEEAGEVVALYKSDATATPEALAQAYNVSARDVRRALKAAGVEERTVTVESDADLGIGQDDAPAAPAAMDANAALAAALQSPAFAAAVQQAVAAQMAQLGHKGAPADDGRFADFMKAMERFVEAQEVQRPGYQKPLSADELELRAEGHREMVRLIAEAKAEGVKPLYIVGPGKFYGNSPNGPILIEEGSPIATYLTPAEDWVPQNETAIRIKTAFMQFIGEPTPEIGEQIAQAMLRAKGQEPTLATAETIRHEANVEVLDAPRAQVRPQRVLGTVAPERHGVSMPGQPGAMPQPAGPFEVG